MKSEVLWLFSIFGREVFGKNDRSSQEWLRKCIRFFFGAKSCGRWNYKNQKDTGQKPSCPLWPCWHEGFGVGGVEAEPTPISMQNALGGTINAHKNVNCRNVSCTRKTLEYSYLFLPCLQNAPYFLSNLFQMISHSRFWGVFIRTIAFICPKTTLSQQPFH